MNELTVLEIAKNALVVGVQVSLPLLLTSLVVGTLIGVVMAATQIQEFTLTFVPKMICMGLVLLLTGPWMLRSLIGFAQLMLRQIPSIAQ